MEKNKKYDLESVEIEVEKGIAVVVSTTVVRRRESLTPLLTNLNTY